MATADALLTFAGQRSSGKDVRSSNALAVEHVASILRSSFGPQGLDKMLVDDIGDVLITNDGATILQQLDVEHVAGKILVDLSTLQDKEVGDGTTSVVLLAAELIKRGHGLVQQGIHPSVVIAGYRHAAKTALSYIHKNLVYHISESEQPDLLKKIAATALSSKILGNAGDHFVNLAVEAISKVKSVNDTGDIKYPVQAVGIMKIQGRSMRESCVVNGLALSQISRAAQGMPKKIVGAKVALIDFGIKQHRMYLGVNILVEDPEELEKIRLREKNICKERVQKILASGANVVLSSQGIDDMALKYFVEAGVFAVRRVAASDMKRIALATGAKRVLTMTTNSTENGEEFDPAWLGSCGEVCEERIGDWDCVFLRDCPKDRATSIVLRGANDFMIEEAERCVHDALCALSKSLETPDVCVGGGAVETALSLYLSDLAQTLGSREQLAVAEFAEGLLVIPRTLAMNAAADSTELIAQLRACHVKAQRAKTSAEQEEYKWHGLDLRNNKVRNNFEAGVFEPELIKTKVIKSATEAAITILRIDDFIQLDAKPQQGGPGEED